jgi:hypothetical protein
MPYEPDFLAHRDEFERALAQVRTVSDWADFRSRFFHDMPWPRRSPEALRAARGDGAPVLQGGRAFHRSPLADDVTPEARYAYFQALAVGLAATYPAGAPDGGVRWHCPACELFTDAPGDPECPSCGRKLLEMRLAPPPPRR